MIPGIVVLFYRSPLCMVVWERIPNENNVNSILFSILRANQSIKKIFLKVLNKMLLSFERWSVIVFTNFAKETLSRMMSKHSTFAKD